MIASERTALLEQLAFGDDQVTVRIPRETLAEIAAEWIAQLRREAGDVACRACNGEGRLRIAGPNSQRDAGDVREVECGYCDGSGEGAGVQ